MSAGDLLREDDVKLAEPCPGRAETRPQDGCRTSPTVTAGSFAIADPVTGVFSVSESAAGLPHPVPQRVTLSPARAGRIEATPRASGGPTKKPSVVVTTGKGPAPSVAKNVSSAMAMSEMATVYSGEIARIPGVRTWTLTPQLWAPGYGVGTSPLIWPVPT